MEDQEAPPIPDKEPPRHQLSRPGEPEYIYGSALIQVEQPASEAFADFGGLDPAVLNLKLRAIFDALTFGQRENILRSLGYEPVQKFYDVTSGAWLKGHRFYGFGDAGGLAGSFDGYDTAEEAIAAIQLEHPGTAIGTLQEDLGAEPITVLTGKAFVEQLQKVERLSTYGRLA